MTSVVVASKLDSITDLLTWSMLLILRLTLRHGGRQQQPRVLCVCVCHKGNRGKEQHFSFERSLIDCQILTVCVCYLLGLLLFVPVVLLKPAVSIESKHEVTILSGLNEFVVKFHGPAGSKNLSHCIFCSDSCALY